MASIFTDEDTIKLITHIISKLSFYSNSSFLINNLDFLGYQADKFFYIFYNYDKAYQDNKKKGLIKINKNVTYTKVSIDKIYNLAQEFFDFHDINIDVSDLVKTGKFIINNIKEKLDNKEITIQEYNNLRFNAHINNGTIYFNYCGDIIDVSILIHEITHLRNQPADPKSPRTEVNDFITESISYAEEFISLDFLKSKGYEDDYNNYLYDIFYTSLDLCDKVFFINKVLYVYNQKSDISKNSYIDIYKNEKNYEVSLKELYKLIINNNSYIKLIWSFLGYISGLYLYIMYLENHNYLVTIEKLNAAITKEKCTWKEIFEILKINNPSELFKEMYSKIENFVKLEIEKFQKQSN